MKSRRKLANILFYLALILGMFLPYKFDFLFQYEDNKLPYEVAQFILTCVAAYIILIYTAKQICEWIKTSGKE